MGAYFALLETAPEKRDEATDRTITEAFDELPFFGDKLPPIPGPLMPGETWKLKPSPFHGRGKYTIALAKPVEMIRQNPCAWVRIQPVIFGVENGITCENIIGIFGTLSAVVSHRWFFYTINNLSTAVFEIVLIWIKIFHQNLTKLNAVRTNMLLLSITHITVGLARAMLNHQKRHKRGKRVIQSILAGDVDSNEKEAATLDKAKEVVSQLYSKVSTKIKMPKLKKKKQKGTRIIDEETWDQNVTRKIAGQKLREHFLEFRSNYITNKKLLAAGKTNKRGEAEFEIIYEELQEVERTLIEETNSKFRVRAAQLNIWTYTSHEELGLRDFLMLEPLVVAFLDLVMPEAENKFQQSFPVYQKFDTSNLTPERLLGPYQRPIMETIISITKRGFATFSSQTYGDELPGLNQCVKGLDEDTAEMIKKLFSSEDMVDKYVALEMAGIAWQLVEKKEIDLL